MYPEELVKPMRADLATAGFEELYTSEAVENALKQAGTTLVVVNSVCGCAAANARPALFKDGELVHMIERHHIEGRPAELIAENLMEAYNEFC